MAEIHLPQVMIAILCTFHPSQSLSSFSPSPLFHSGSFIISDMSKRVFGYFVLTYLQLYCYRPIPFASESSLPLFFHHLICSLSLPFLLSRSRQKWLTKLVSHFSNGIGLQNYNKTQVHLGTVLNGRKFAFFKSFKKHYPILENNQYLLSIFHKILF